MFIALEIFLELLKHPYKTSIFYDSKIVYKKGSDTALEINLSDIVGVYKTAMCNENFQTQKFISKKLFIFATFFGGKFIFFVLLNKKIRFKIYTSYLIKKEKNIINFLPKESDNMEIKRYFFDKINIDIEKAQCNFIVS